MNYSILSVAELEAVEAAIWYDEQRRGLGDEFLDELQEAFVRVQSTPESFAPLECYLGHHAIRRCLLKRFPYVVIFRCRPQEVLVIAVSHVRRRPLYWLDRID